MCWLLKAKWSLLDFVCLRSKLRKLRESLEKPEVNFRLIDWVLSWQMREVYGIQSWFMESSWNSSLSLSSYCSFLLIFTVGFLNICFTPYTRSNATVQINTSSCIRLKELVSDAIRGTKRSTYKTHLQWLNIPRFHMRCYEECFWVDDILYGRM